MPDAYSERLDQALLFTAQAFRAKHRKGTPVAYLNHLLAVASMVGDGGGDEDQIIAALLHDWLEDIPGATEAELVERFGERVCDLVVACSDCDGAPKPPWDERKKAYITHLYDAPADVKLISVADKLHNCRSLVVDLRAQGQAVFEHFNAKKAGTLWYYQALVPALEANGWEHYLLDQLKLEVELLVALADD